MSAFLPETDSEDELPPGWEERATFQGDVYYANHDQAVTQWTHPRTGQRKAVSNKLPFGWERKILEDNKVLYVDHVNKRTTYTDPRLAFAVEKRSQQTAFRQRFDASSTALQVLHGLDLSGQLAIVTGASSGIGYHTARALAFHGCEVVLACRNEVKAEAAISAIRADRPAARCNFLALDLSSLASVRQFVHRLAVLHPSRAPGLLVLNAGLFGLPLTQTEDGLETMMQVNYLAHCYLVRLLLPRLLTSALTCRLVVVTSESHRFSDTTAENMSPFQFSPLPSAFCSIQQYNDSKLFCLLFAQALHARYSHMGLRCLAVHPGNLVYSGLKNSWWVYRILFALARPFTKSLPQAASSVVFALCSPDLESVEDFTYINNCFPTKPSDVALSATAADRLWELTSQLLEQTCEIIPAQHQ